MKIIFNGQVPPLSTTIGKFTAFEASPTYDFAL